MALSDERRKALLAYCHLTELQDDPEVQVVIPALYEAAVGYMDQAGISLPEAGTPRAAQYDLCVNAMVLDWWDHRDMKEPSSSSVENVAFRRMINQLKLTDPLLGVSDMDTPTA